MSDEFLRSHDGYRVEQLFKEILSQTQDIDQTLLDKKESDDIPSINTVDDDHDSESLLEWERKAIEEAIGAVGIDVLAFYKSYRYINCTPAKGKWGIFIWDKGAKYLQYEMKLFGLIASNSSELAHAFLHTHEFYHFKADLQILHLSQVAKRPLYTLLHQAIGKNGSLFVEESLANREVISWANRLKNEHPKLRLFAEHFILTKQFGAYANIKASPKRLQLQWMSDVLEGELNTTKLHHGTEHWQNLLPRFIDNRKDVCPCYIFNTNTKFWLRSRLQQ